MPQLDFPKFNGTNPKYWVQQCVTYFDLYDIPPENWVKLATINFSGTAAFWMQTVELNLKKCSWDHLCQLVIDRFDRDQFNHFIRQFFHAKQTGSVPEYVTLFDELMHQLLAHDPLINPAILTGRFIDGLKSDIRAAVLLHRPKDLDTASSLAILQEEVLSGAYTKEYKRLDASYSSRSLSKSFSSNSSPVENKPGTPTVPADEKLAALMRYRKSKGLCFKCGGKWGPQHKCPSSVPLNMIEEVWHMLSDGLEEPADPSSDSDPDELMALSDQAVHGTTAAHTLRLYAYIQQKPSIILVDSGSSHNFISERVAANLQPWTPLQSSLSVRVADGSLLPCTHEVVNCSWSAQGVLFTTTFKILPLQCYDAILGMEWLEAFSPMQIQWKEKWLSFQLQNSTVKLRGIPDGTSLCQEITLNQLTAMAKHNELWHIVELYSVESPVTQSELPHQLQQLIHKFSDLFQEPTGASPTRALTHSIPLVPGVQPFRMKPYRYTPAQKDEIEKQIAHLLKANMIKESTSPFASPALLVKKKSGEWRLCVDYRKLNAYTIKNKFPMPIIEELFEELYGACWFSTLDLRSGFHQIMVAPEDQYKTAFQTHSGHYEYSVMPYGLTGAPATFQSVMNHVLAPLLRKCVVVFIDDILIYSTSFEEHIRHVQQVFQLLQDHQFKVRLSKCSFAQQKLHYLGHVLTPNGVSTDPSKVQDVQNWPSPTSVKDVRSFLGLAGYYRRFVQHFGMIAKPLTDLLKKGTIFIWSKDCETAFQLLKNALLTAPVLALPNFSKPFVVETDASETGVGAVLQQDGHPIAYVSKALGPRTQGLSTYEKESLAILLAIDQWKAYLYPAEFIIHTDQKSLVHLTDQRLHSYWQQKVLTKLMSYQYKITYKKGSTNCAADSLSRAPQMGSYLNAISVVQPVWLQALLASYDSNPVAQKLLSALAIHNPDGHFSLQHGIIKYKSTIWLGHSVELQTKVTDQLHSTPLGGHSGAFVTFQRVSKLFYWPHMQATIREFVSSCTVCQQVKTERVPYPGLLQPLPVPTKAWSVVTMDFIEGLPTSAGYSCIFVVVDKFSKYSHFLKLKHPFSAIQVAQQYMEHVYKLHGMPSAIVSDRDKIFTSLLWKELFKLSGTQLCMSSAYHPQSDGQTERVNQCIENFLRCFIHACPKQWSQWLHLAEYWYNTCHHSALQHSPFEILYGHHPTHFGIDPDQDCAIPELSDWLQKRQSITALIRQQLLRAQQRMKHQADKHRTERSFSVGDRVWLKLQPYVQRSVSSRISSKLSYRYFGPFEIEARVGAVAYKLKLPPSSSIHNVFHVSLLKPVKGMGSVPYIPLPTDDISMQSPERVLDRRATTRNNRLYHQLLVQWSGSSPELATWEDEDDLLRQFPQFTAWGQAVANGGGNVTVRSVDNLKLSKRKRRPSTKYGGPEWSK
jgi:hypothetical protein